MKAEVSSDQSQAFTLAINSLVFFLGGGQFKMGFLCITVLVAQELIL